MANLYEILADAQNGEAMAEIGRAYGLTQEQTDAAVAALLPAISMGLKRATETPEGLGNLFALMAQQPYLYASYNDPRAAFSPQALAAGNAALSQMFGSPDASRAIAAQAQNLSGVTSAILKKLLPVIVGMIISGLMRSGSGRAAPQAPQPAPAPAPDQGGGLIDILRQIFQQGRPETTGQPRAGSGSTPWGIPPIGDILGEPKKDVANTPQPVPQTPRQSDRPVHSNRLGGWHGAGRRCARPDSARAGEGHSRRTRQTGHRRSVRDRHPRDIEARRSRPDAELLEAISSARSCAKCSAAKAENCNCPARRQAWARRCSEIGSRPARTSTRARSTACKRCSTASLARNVADVPSHSSRMEGVGIHFCRHKSHASRL